MVFFHFSYDLNYFRFISIHQLQDPFWLSFRWLIVSMFLFAAGISLVIVYGKGIRFPHLLKRLAILGGAALAVTIATYLIFPKAWVYFGILHLIFISTILGLLFVSKAKTSFLVGIAILLAYWSGIWTETGTFRLLQPLLHLPRYTVDLAPLLPWFGVYLLGIAFASAGLHIRIEKHLPAHPFPLLRRAGRHSLAIYLLHQPLLFGLLFLLWKFQG